MKIVLVTGGFDPITLHSVMCYEKDKPAGYIIGRVIKKEKEVAT